MHPFHLSYRFDGITHLAPHYMPSVMKGIVLTSTGEIFATPSAAELVNLFNRSPKVGLNFGKISGFEEGDNGEKESQE